MEAAARPPANHTKKGNRMAEQITQDQVIRQVVDTHPGIDQVFKAHGLPCTGCHVSTYETVAGGARTHRLNVDELLADLNQFAVGGTVPAPKKILMVKTPSAGPTRREG